MTYTGTKGFQIKICIYSHYRQEESASYRFFIILNGEISGRQTYYNLPS